MTALAEYLRASRRRMQPGEFDCILWLAGWIALNGHPDPAQPWRGRYRTWRGAQAIATRAGGLADLARDAAARIGLVEIDPAEAVAGDVAVGLMEGEVAPCGLIRAGGYWAALSVGAGLVVGRASIAAAWRV